MRILFLNHTGARSGAENAMLRLLEAIPEQHARAVACPPEGMLKPAVDERGIDQFDLPGTDISFRLRPLQTVAGMLRLSMSAFLLRRIARAFRTDVVHANTPRAGLIAVVTRRLGGPPVVVQCHDHMPRSRVGNIARRVIAREAAVVVAVTGQTADDFNHGLRRPKARRVYISVDHARFSPAARGSTAVRSELGLPATGTPLLAQVAQITPWKGQDTAIRALRAVREHFDAHLLLVGDAAVSSQRYDNVAFRQSLERMTRELGVESAVHFLGRRSDVAELMGAADLLLLPSWDEPFGTAVAEAMAVGTPVLVTKSGGVREYVADGVNGRVLPPHDADAWAAATIDLLGDAETLSRMGAANVRAAAQFTDERYAGDMLEAYARAMSA